MKADRAAQMQPTKDGEFDFEETDMTLHVSRMMGSLSEKFQEMSDEIVSKIDGMGSRIDGLEKQLSTLAQQLPADSTSSK